jgi:hypothetical protein
MMANSARIAQRTLNPQSQSTYLHADSNAYGWGVVLNDNPAYKARGFLHDTNTSHGRSYVPYDSQSSPFYRSYGDATSYYTRTTPPSWRRCPKWPLAPPS